MSEENLKPCPFCGSKDLFVQDIPIIGECVISCGDCEAALADSSKEKAIDRWNTRYLED